MLLELHDHRQANHFKTTMLVLPSASSTSTTYSRRLLLHTTPLYNHNQPSNWVAASAPPVGENTNAPNAAGEGGFDANVVMILAVLLCALICALGLNSVVRCALRCSSHMTIDGGSARCASHTGVKKKALRALPTLPYSAGLKLPGSNSECAICLSEFVAGERVRVLPKCNHGFHVKCIDPWLVAHSSCPTCRRCLFNTCQKTSRCAELASPSVPPPVIVPLEREGLVTGYMHAH